MEGSCEEGNEPSCSINWNFVSSVTSHGLCSMKLVSVVAAAAAVVVVVAVVLEAAAGGMVALLK
jgi:preprotein translocase subunit SecF